MLGSHGKKKKQYWKSKWSVFKKACSILKPRTVCGNLGVLYWTRIGETYYIQKSTWNMSKDNHTCRSHRESPVEKRQYSSRLLGEIVTLSDVLYLDIASSRFKSIDGEREKTDHPINQPNLVSVDLSYFPSWRLFLPECHSNLNLLSLKMWVSLSQHNISLDTSF